MIHNLFPPIKTALTIFLSIALAQCGLSRAWADPVTLPEAPPPAVVPGGPDATDLAASAPIGTDLAMLYYHVPADGSAPITIHPSRAAMPITLSAGTGAETRLALDVGAMNSQAESQGWPTWLTVTAWVAGVAIVGLAAWGIVEATQSSGSSTSGDHTHIDVSGNGNQINLGSPNHNSPTQTSTTTTTGSGD